MISVDNLEILFWDVFSCMLSIVTEFNFEEIIASVMILEKPLFFHEVFDGTTFSSRISWINVRYPVYLPRIE